MVSQCSLCGFLSPSLNLHISHLRLVHSRDPSFHITCGIDCCLEEFRTFSSFNSHTYRFHRIALGLEEPEQLPVPSTSVLDEEFHELTSEREYDGLTPVVEMDHGDVDDPSVELQPSASHQPTDRDFIVTNAKHILKLTEGRLLSQVAVADVIQMCRDVSQQALTQVKRGVLHSLAMNGIQCSEIFGLDETISKVADPFEGISTAYLREKFFKDNFNYLVRYMLYPCSYLCTVYRQSVYVIMDSPLHIYVDMCVYVCVCVYCLKLQPQNGFLCLALAADK